ncbi:MAG: CDP-alcohol phosphatidyltransferase family protein [Blastocatellia bacterium]|nr:CDP-alcohol phosphatidyltransferase family protein [Blastocatellia bacterium]
MENIAFKDAQRELNGLTAGWEKRTLIWIANRLPKWVNSDHLTVLGLVALLFCGIFYSLSPTNPWLYLNLVNLMLAVNWFGDSLDGTVARVRNKSRPRYGFYVDHIVDTFGTFFLFGGMALSGFMSYQVAFGLLIVYYMLSINSYLAAYTIGKFQISYAAFGPTELRIVLAIGNIALLYHPHSTIWGTKYLLFDVGGVVSMLGMTGILLFSVTRNTMYLYDKERV